MHTICVCVCAVIYSYLVVFFPPQSLCVCVCVSMFVCPVCCSFGVSFCSISIYYIEMSLHELNCHCRICSKLFLCHLCDLWTYKKLRMFEIDSGPGKTGIRVCFAREAQASVMRGKILPFPFCSLTLSFSVSAAHQHRSVVVVVGFRSKWIEQILMFYCLSFTFVVVLLFEIIVSYFRLSLVLYTPNAKIHNANVSSFIVVVVFCVCFFSGKLFTFAD